MTQKIVSKSGDLLNSMPMAFDAVLTNSTQQDSLKSKLSHLTTAIYETAKWMLVNNRDK